MSRNCKYICAFPGINLHGDELYFFHTQMWFPALVRDYWRFESDFRCFLRSYHRIKSIVEEIESIMGARAERSSLSWVCIPQKSLAIARDFWNTNSFGWTPFRPGTHDGLSIWFISKFCPSNFEYHALWYKMGGPFLSVLPGCYLLSWNVVWYMECNLNLEPNRPPCKNMSNILT